MRIIGSAVIALSVVAVVAWRATRARVPIAQPPAIAAPIGHPAEAAAPPAKEPKIPRRPVVRLSRGSGSSLRPTSMLQLVAKSDTILVGRAEAIIRVARTPPNNADGFPHTVFLVDVERYVRSDGAPGKPGSVKVYIRGGVLDGAALMSEGSPMLTLGERYLLFLCASPGRDQWAMSGGTWGISRRRDEFTVAFPTEGIIRLVQGRTDVPQDGFQQIVQWRFERGGDTLLGLTEEEASNQIRWTTSRLPSLVGDREWFDLP